MVKRVLAVLLAFLCGLLAPAAAQDASKDQAPAVELNRLVVDQAGLFSPAFTDAMNARLDVVEARTGASFVVLTLQSLGGKEIEELADAALSAVLQEKPRPVVGTILVLVPSEREMVFQSQNLALSEEEAEIDGLSEEEVARFMNEGLALVERLAPKLSALATRYYSDGDWETGTEAIVDLIERDSQALVPLKRDREIEAESDRAA